MYHGRRKAQDKRSPQQIQAQQRQAQRINRQLEQFIKLRHKGVTPNSTLSSSDSNTTNETTNIPTLQKALQFTRILMQLCSDIPTIFNYYRELLEIQIKAIAQEIERKSFEGAKSSPNDSQPKEQPPAEKSPVEQPPKEQLPAEQSKQIPHKAVACPPDYTKLIGLLVQELKLSTKLIQADSKSYTLWVHRQWLVRQLTTYYPNVIDKEKELCAALLDKDEKNFHVWNYRHWLNSLILNVEQELQFTLKKVNSNPFNFSAYHFRIKYLIKKYGTHPINDCHLTFGMPEDVFRSECQAVKVAMFLSPKEEAPWTYAIWLYKRLVPCFVISETVDQSKMIKRICFNLKVKGLTKSEYSSDNVLSSVWTTKHHIQHSKQMAFQKVNGVQVLNNTANQAPKQVQQQSNSTDTVPHQTPMAVSIEHTGFNFQLDRPKLSQISLIKKQVQQMIGAIEQVEAQQGYCRNALLARMDLFKIMMQCGTTPTEWNQYCETAIAMCERIQKESYTLYHYIENQKNDWRRKTRQGERSPEEQALRCLWV